VQQVQQRQEPPRAPTPQRQPPERQPAQSCAVGTDCFNQRQSQAVLKEQSESTAACKATDCQNCAQGSVCVLRSPGNRLSGCACVRAVDSFP
jgi:hypothetical protein